MLSRRASLALIGGGVILAAGGAGAAFTLTRTPHAALEPWARAGRYPDPRMRALSWALLAPNPHNRQPWEAELIGDDRVAIWRDPTRDLPVTDPFARQLTIGMGCFLELMRMAAAAEGRRVATALFPEGDAGPVAHCRFEEAGAESDPLFAHAGARRSHKETFEGRAVSAEAAAPLTRHAAVYRDETTVAPIKRLAHDAWMAEMATPAALRESVDLLRIGRTEIEAQPDGIDLGGAKLEALAALGLLTREAAADPDNPGTRGAIEATAEAIRAAPAMTAVITPANDRASQIEAGRRWLRLNLAATGAGLKLRPVSQALQEYPEVASHRAEIHERLAGDGATVQMLGLLGYGRATPPAPRWALERRMRHG
jgi:hypothetical protein